MADPTIREQIVKYLDAFGKTQTWLAARVQVAQPSVSAWINGRTTADGRTYYPTPTQANQEAIARAFGVSRQVFLFHDPPRVTEAA